jgi:D-alanyl-D-alanine carboxypeptidase/D-alanyl-D-alanine-endopeptidase (penicillin-binding protein 4)
MRILFLSFIICVPFLSYSQNKLQKAVNTFVGDPEMQFASISFCAIDMEKNTVLSEHNPDLSLITASTMKAITTGTALAILGQDFKFETYLEYDGTIKDGVLNGNLYFTGTGDPSLGSPFMEEADKLPVLSGEFAQALKKAGIKSIKGNVIGDGSYFEAATTVPSWQWMDMGNHFGAGITGINLHDNLYFIGLQQTNVLGAQPQIKYIRPEQHLKFSNELTSAGKNTGDNAYIFAAPFGSEAWIRGTIPVGSGSFSIMGAVTDPEFFSADWLFHALKSQGITISGKPISYRTSKNKLERKKIHTHYSPSLSKLILHTNENSRNLYCEAYVKMIGKKLKKEGSQESGIAAINEFWRTRGIDTRGFFMEDGSGLSARNGVSAKIMAQMLRKMFIDKASFPNYYNLLAISGETGNFKYFGKGTILQSNLHGKGGTMNRVRSYTGYVTTKSKKKVAFSIIVNNFNCSGTTIRQRVENLLITIANMEE